MNLINFGKARSEDSRMSLTDADAYTLPQQVRFIRVISGAAWVSVGREDLIVRPQETLYLQPNRPGAVVTALGHQRLEFEMME